MVQWSDVANNSAVDCPSEYYRRLTAEILSKVEHLGPLSDPRDEFKRVYRFLHYNEPDRIVAVVDDLLESLKRRNLKQPAARNAWSYVVGALDQWILRARVLYLAAGVLEGTLRSRLNAHMTERLGPEWFKTGAVPSSVGGLAERDAAAARVVRIHVALDDLASHGNAGQFAQEVDEALKAGPSAAPTGSAFLAGLTLAATIAFFDTKRLWTKGPLLREIFQRGGSEPLREEVTSTLHVIRRIRNDIAHYRPDESTSFESGLYALAKLSMWLGVDLQHFYGSVDTRATTELSLLLARDEHGGRLAGACRFESCAIKPLDRYMVKAPIGADDVAPSPEYACVLHRVTMRSAEHRPLGV